MIKFLIQDIDEIKTIKNDLIEKVCNVSELTEHTFLEGIEIGALGNLSKLRESLNSKNPKILYITEVENKLYYKEYGLNNGTFIEMNKDINIGKEYILWVKKIEITAEKEELDILKIIVSVDGGSTYVTYKNNIWSSIEKNEEIVALEGMELLETNNLSEEAIKELTESVQSIRFCFLIRKENQNSILNISNVKMEYEVKEGVKI